MWKLLKTSWNLRAALRWAVRFVFFIVAAKHGIGMILTYARDLIRDPWSERPLFERHFGEKLEDSAAEFRKEVLAKKWPLPTDNGMSDRGKPL